MRIGVGTNDLGKAGLEAALNQPVASEREGFDTQWYAQVFGADALTMIAMAGPSTQRIEFATAVVPTYTRHPMMLAQQALTVQAATNGRLTLGIGPSHAMVVEGMWGLSYEKPARHMREYLAVLMPLLQEGKVQFSGETYRVAGQIRVPAPKPPSVIISALAPAMLKIAGELTDGTVTWMAGTKTIATHVAPKINAAATAAGRPQPRVCVGLPIAVHKDVAAVREACNKLLVTYGQLPNYRRMLDIEGEGSDPGAVAIAGDEGAVEKQLRDLASAGCTDFYAAILPVGDDPAETIKRTREFLRSLLGKV